MGTTVAYAMRILQNLLMVTAYRCRTLIFTENVRLTSNFNGIVHAWTGDMRMAVTLAPFTQTIASPILLLLIINNTSRSTFLIKHVVPIATMARVTRFKTNTMPILMMRHKDISGRTPKTVTRTSITKISFDFPTHTKILTKKSALHKLMAVTKFSVLTMTLLIRCTLLMRSRREAHYDVEMQTHIHTDT